MNIAKKLPKGISGLLKTIGEMAGSRGEKAYLVGGSVRDLLLGKAITDIDVTIEGDAIGLGKKLSAKFDKKIVTYPKFGTCTIRDLKGHEIDLATARKEVYERPAAFPTVTPSVLKDDLLRRDFTVNAMAMSLDKADFGRVIDPCGGMKDLGKGRIRVMHDKSFVDDPTRIFRAVRFEKRFNFTITRHTKNLMSDAVGAGMLDLLNAQRVRKEVLHKGERICLHKDRDAFRRP